MNTPRLLILAMAVVALIVSRPGRCEVELAIGTLDCKLGQSARWGSAWCDLSPTRDFSAGSTIELSLVPSGSQVVLVRLLRYENDPNDPVGIVGGKRQVDNSGRIIFQLDRELRDIKQISVHGGSLAWTINLGANNPPAVLTEVKVIRR